MADGPYPVRITVVECGNPGCPVAAGKQGRTWRVDTVAPKGMCALAFATMMPYIWNFRHGGVSDGPNPDSYLVSCPAGADGVLYKVERVSGEG